MYVSHERECSFLFLSMNGSYFTCTLEWLTVSMCKNWQIYLQLFVFDIYSVFKHVLHGDTFQGPGDTSTPLHILRGHKLLIPNTLIQLNKRGRLVSTKPTCRHKQQPWANIPRILIPYNRQHPLVETSHPLRIRNLILKPDAIPFTYSIHSTSPKLRR